MKPLSALVALSLLVGCSDTDKIERLEKALQAQEEELRRTGGGKMTVEEYANGQLKSRGYIKGNNVRTGEWTFWHENGQKESEGSYVDHQKEGRWTEWTPEGWTKGSYKDGKRDGPWTWWHENGQKERESFYKDGKLDGPWTFWDENGQKRSEGSYKDDNRDGPWTFWDENGQKKAEGAFKDDKRDGPWTEWDVNGSIVHWRQMNVAIAELQARDEVGDSKVVVQHVLVAFQGSGTRATRSKEAAEKLAGEVWQRAQAGEDFLELVKANTDDSPPGIYGMVNDASKANRANNEFFRGDMVPAFGNVGWRLQVGEIGVAPYDPKASPYGWHIIKRLK